MQFTEAFACNRGCPASVANAPGIAIQDPPRVSPGFFLALRDKYNMHAETLDLYGKPVNIREIILPPTKTTMPPKKKVSPKVKVEEWVHFDPDQYELAINEMVHHSFKITHSNITSGGVRVSRDKGLQLPYVSVRSLIGNGQSVLTDTVGKGPASIKIHKQITAVALGQASNAPVEEVEMIQGFLATASDTPYVKCESISPRLRQILLPTDDGYLAVSPLSAVGIGAMLGDSVKQHNDRVDEQNKDKQNTDRPLKKITWASIQIGGSKPVNVGSLAYKMHRPLVASFPLSNNPLRHALSLHHKGLELTRFPSKLVQEYVQWRNELSGKIAGDMESRTRLTVFLGRFARHWLNIGADAHELLKEHADAIPGQSVTSETLNAFDRGLIECRLRDSSWNYQFASRLAKNIALLEKDEKRQFEYTKTDINTMGTLIRGILV